MYHPHNCAIDIPSDTSNPHCLIYPLTEQKGIEVYIQEAIITMLNLSIQVSYSCWFPLCEKEKRRFLALH